MVFLFAALATFILVIGVHEAGHALAAKYFNICIKRISLGLGRPLLRWRRKNVEWIWAIWPLGGYVHLLNSRIEPVEEKDLLYSFDKKPVAVRIIVLAAGAVANLLFALALFTGYFMLGYQEQIPVIAQTISGSIAEEAGIKAGDVLLAVDGRDVRNWQDVAGAFLSKLGKEGLILKIQRQQSVMTVVLSFTKLTMRASGNFLAQFGLVADNSVKYQNTIKGTGLGQALVLAGIKTYKTGQYFYLITAKIISGQIPLSLLLGPLSLFSASAVSLKQGLAAFLSFIAVLSLAVAFLNLIPFPGLDGGSILYVLIEKIRGKPISIALEILLYQTALILFFILLVQLLVNDGQRLLQHYVAVRAQQTTSTR